MRWCFENTATPYSEAILDLLANDGRAYVPLLWYFEFVSVISKAQRSGVITSDKARAFIDQLSALPISSDARHPRENVEAVNRLAVSSGLTGYDAAYLELAIRLGFPLATLDDELRHAASAANVPLVPLNL